MLRAFDTDKRIALFLFILTSSIYFATISGITSSNDGSHYALVRALVERRSFEISPYMDFTEHQDYAMDGDLRFSDRPPGTALAAAPLYGLSWFAPMPAGLPSKHDAANPRLLFAVLLSPLAGAAAISVFYLLLRHHFDRSRSSAVLTSLALAFGTTMWKYGSVLYSHAISTLVILLALYLVLRAWNQPLSGRSAFALGFLLGYAPLIEYPNLLISILLGLAWLSGFRPIQRALTHPSFAMLILGGLIPAAFLLIYNTLNFDGPFDLSTFNVDIARWPQNENFASDFAAPLDKGLMGLLFYGSENQGIFLLSPITLLCVLGIVPALRHSRSRTILALGLFLVMLFLFAKSTTFNSTTNDGRYLTPFLFLWLIPLAFWLDQAYLLQQHDLTKLALSLLVFGLLFFSIRNQFVHIAFSWNYDLDLAQLKPGAVIPQNIAYLLAIVFPNIRNLPLLWGAEAVAIAIGVLVDEWRLRSGRGMLNELTAQRNT